MQEIEGAKVQGEESRKRIYNFIVKYIIENGFPPSTREICDGVYLSSTSSVNAHLKKMHEIGMIELVQYQPRCIRVPGMKFVREEV